MGGGVLPSTGFEIHPQIYELRRECLFGIGALRLRVRPLNHSLTSMAVNEAVEM
jgi:hypothetical protein